jgi:RND family efflux transporter MFP subunit
MVVAMKNTGLMILPLALMLSLSSCSCSKQEATNSKKAEPSATQTIEVSTAEVIERSMRRSLEVVGSLEAQDDVTVSSQLSGNLEDITIDVGSVVRQGQVIARLDPRELRFRAEQQEAALRQAEAKLGVRPGEKIDPQKQPDVRAARSALDRARYDWDAAQTLVDKGDISRQQFDVYRRAFEQAEARYEAALENVRNLEAAIEEKRAQLALAKKQLSDTEILSPISGVVREKLASRGEYLQPGKPIATIVQINPLRLRLEIPESFAATISQGMTVSLQVDAFADQHFEGKIRRINPSIDEKSRSLIAEAEVSNTTGKLKPGMFARAQIVSEKEGVALMVPEKAVVSIAGINKVFVVAGNQAAERMVKLGVRDGSMVEVVEGVRVGERVITSQTDKLQDGAAVSTPVS